VRMRGDALVTCTWAYLLRLASFVAALLGAGPGRKLQMRTAIGVTCKCKDTAFGLHLCENTAAYGVGSGLHIQLTRPVTSWDYEEGCTHVQVLLLLADSKHTAVI
jgi:hypothetical protein